MANLNRAPRLFHVDDLSMALEAIKGSPHFNVVLSASSVAQALQYIPEQLLKKDARVALLDNNIGGVSGEVIATKIRQTMSGLSIISFSADNNITWGDVNLLKNVSFADLANVISYVAPAKKPTRI